LPAGALNVVTGSGSLIGEMIVKDDRVSKISFTGSPAVGIGIRNKAGFKRVTLELGSNAAVIIDKGVNLDNIISRGYAFFVTPKSSRVFHNG
jgi:acyl-CoA reductase-like NAD-dependent aldehyde dehydrogenase